MSQHDATPEMFQFAMARTHFDLGAIVSNCNRTSQKLREDLQKLTEIKNGILATAQRSGGDQRESALAVAEMIDIEAFQELIQLLSITDNPVLDALINASANCAVLGKPAKNLDGSMATNTSTLVG